MSFQATLKQHRERAGLTPEALGQLAGVHAQTVRKLEDGQRTWPRLDIAAKLARALGVSLDAMCR